MLCVNNSQIISASKCFLWHLQFIYLLYSYQKHFDDVKGEVSLPQHISEVELIDARSLGKMIYIFSARKNI